MPVKSESACSNRAFSMDDVSQPLSTTACMAAFSSSPMTAPEAGTFTVGVNVGETPLFTALLPYETLCNGRRDRL
jgi:hypothetical protein